MKRIVHFLITLGLGALAFGETPELIWKYPADIASRNLYYGPGGRKDAPRGPFKFEKEDLEGTNPKFDVRDPHGAKWKVKLGEEARPETAASRLVWAAGYFTDEDYFLPVVHVDGLPARLHRGQKLVGPAGTIHGVRLKRSIKGEEKIGDWQWKRDPFTGTRELNGLRVMMALINNWDLKDVNNKVYDLAPKYAQPERLYVVSDLGATFGTTGRSVTRAEGKGNLKAYSHSHFIRSVHDGVVDFYVPSRPALIHLVEFPEFVRRIEMRSIGEKIPVGDCRWIGHILGRLSMRQIRSAFLAAGYSPADAREFSEIVEDRIVQLNHL